MQLKIRRTQRDGGVVSKSVVFCLDARVSFSAQETADLKRYKLYKQVIYNSEASKRLIDRGNDAVDGTARGALKGLGLMALAAMRLNITVESLERGQHIECKSMDELLAAEDALFEACENLRKYLDTAATFDGREILVDFSSDKQPEAIAVTPVRQLVAPPPVPVTVAPTALPPPPIAPAPGGVPSFEQVQEPARSWESPSTDDPVERVKRFYRETENAGPITAIIAAVLLLLLLFSCSG